MDYSCAFDFDFLKKNLLAVDFDSDSKSASVFFEVGPMP